MSGYQSSLASPERSIDPGLIVVARADGAILEWFSPSPEVVVNINGNSVVQIAGFDQTNSPGAPKVPFTSVLLAVPPGANPSFSILQRDEVELSLHAPLAIAQKPQDVLFSGEGEILGGGFSLSNELLPISSQPVTLELVGIVRGVTLFRFTFLPALPSGEMLHFTSHIKVDVSFDVSHQADYKAPDPDDPIIETIRASIINPEHIYVNAELPEAQTTATTPFENPALTAAIEVDQPGITVLTYDLLQSAGFPVSQVDPNNLHLSHGMTEIPFDWKGDSDSDFEDTEEIWFYAAPRFSRWSVNDVYFLWEGQSPGQRINPRSADPTGLPDAMARVETLVEDNFIYTPDCYCPTIPAGRDGDRWVWKLIQLNISKPETLIYPFQLSGIDPDQEASLTVWLIGQTDVPATLDHRVEFSLNGVYLGETAWDGKLAVAAQFQIPSSTLMEGENTLTLNLPGIDGVQVEGVWMDAFQVQYAQAADKPSGETILIQGENSPHAYTLQMASPGQVSVYDVTDPDIPIKLNDVSTGELNSVSFGDPPGAQIHKYWVTTTSGLISPNQVRTLHSMNEGEAYAGADYLIISHSEFFPALDQLVHLHQDQGLIVNVENVQAVYDNFGDGRPDPAAIYNYLAHAYFTWERKPTYVLLVGDGTSDPKGYHSSSTESFIPPYLGDVDPWSDETASDNRYVTVDGNDNLPDMLIGRLPANSLSEAQTMIDKIVQNETHGTTESWQGRVTFVADNADTAGNFPLLSDSILFYLDPRPFYPQRVYFKPTQSPPTDEEIQSFRQRLLNTWNEGTSLLMYTGHSSIHQWAAEVFFHKDEVTNLDNASMLPILLEMTCFTSSFQVPAGSTFDESLLQHPGGGAVATWGSTGLGIATGHHYLARGFLESVYLDPPTDIGIATFKGKLKVAAVNVYTDLIDTFTLLGDPASHLVRSYNHYLPFTHN
jgi:hypothetical protein